MPMVSENVRSSGKTGSDQRAARTTRLTRTGRSRIRLDVQIILAHQSPMRKKVSDLGGIIAMLAATAAFVVCDSFMKIVIEDLPPFEVLFLRSIAASFACAVLVALRAVTGRWLLARLRGAPPISMCPLMGRDRKLPANGQSGAFDQRRHQAAWTCADNYLRSGWSIWGGTINEATRVHHACRRCGGVAGGGASAAT